MDREGNYNMHQAQLFFNIIWNRIYKCEKTNLKNIYHKHYRKFHAVKS